MAQWQRLVRQRRKVRTRQQWDRFCPSVAVGGGNLAGLTFILPALSMALGAPMWSPIWHHALMRFGNVLLMYTVSNLAYAPPRRLLWTFVPPSVWVAWTVMDRFVTHNWPGLRHDLHINVPAAGLDLVFGCAIALFSGKFGRGLEEEATEPDVLAAMHYDTQEGVWPPAPRRSE